MAEDSAPLEPIKQETSAPIAQTATTKKKKTKVWLILGLIGGVLVLGFIGFIAAIFMLVGSVAKDAIVVSDKVVVATINNKPNDVYALTGVTFQKSSSLEDVVAVLNQVSPLLVNGNYTVVNKSVDKSSGSNQTATIDYRITSKDGTFYMRVLLEKQTDGWKMVNFQTDSKPITNESN
jgi:hypothetical protein